MTNTITFLAQGSGAGAPSYNGLIMMALLFVIMWVVMIRPQQKRAKEAKAKQAALKKGDNVVTIGGMHATVNAVSERTVSLRVAEGIYVKYDKTAIAHVVTKDAPQSAKVEK